MKKLLIIVGLLALSGCGTINAWNAVALEKTATDYEGAKKTLKDTDDMKLKLWVDGACSVNVGALQRIASSTGNVNAVNAIFMACPVPNVGVTSILPSGNMTVQTTAVQSSPSVPASPSGK